MLLRATWGCPAQSKCRVSKTPRSLMQDRVEWVGAAGGGSALPGEGEELTVCGCTHTQGCPTTRKSRASRALRCEHTEQLRSHPALRQSEQQETPSMHRAALATPGCPRGIHASRPGDTPGTAHIHPNDNRPAKTTRHTLQRVHSFKTGRDSYSIQLTGTKKTRKSKKMGRQNMPQMKEQEEKP